LFVGETPLRVEGLGMTSGLGAIGAGSTVCLGFAMGVLVGKVVGLAVCCDDCCGAKVKMKLPITIAPNIVPIRAKATAECFIYTINN
jgi:hypothetical protein